MTYDPIITALLQLMAMLILGVGTWAIGRLVQWLGLRNSAQATANFDDALQKSVTYGLQQVQDQIRQHGWDNAEVKNRALAVALTYMNGRFGSTLKAAGVHGPSQAEIDAILAGALDRMFPHAAAVAAASPATPPITAPMPQKMADLTHQDNANSAKSEAVAA